LSQYKNKTSKCILTFKSILYCIINIVTLLHVHVLATLVAVLREVSYKGQFTFCNISYVLLLPEDGHKSGQNMYMQEGYCIYNII